jgi:F-type H+-transporting ATPase subunit b
MPQFDPAWFVPQLFWLAVIFIGLMLVMYRLAVPLVGDTLAKRRAHIEQDLNRAAALKVEIEAIAAAYERTLIDARAEAHAILQGARDRFNETAAERHRQVAAAIQEQVVEAEARIGEAKRAALVDVRAVAAETARAAVERLLGIGVDAGAIDAAVDEALALSPVQQGGHA